MHNKPPSKAPKPTINRIRDVMDHINRYSCHGVKHLAEDSGLDNATISRVISSEVNPHFTTVAKIALAMERTLKRPLHPLELVSDTGAFPTQFVCDLVGCPGCLPDRAWDAFGDITRTYQSIKPGQWVTSKFPHGLPEKGLV